MKKLAILSILTLGCFAQLLAQKNVFLNRDFWSNNPSISTIDEQIAAGNDITERNPAFFDGPTYAILQKVDPKTIAYIIEKEGNGVDKLTHDGRIYLHWAAYSGNKQVVDYLLKNGADAAAVDAHGYSVINFSANAGLNDTTIYDALLAKGADLKATTHNGANALLLSSSSAKDYKIIQYFIDKGLSLNSKDNDGNGAFMYASRSGNINLLKTLKDKGVAYKAINNNGENALFLAAQGTRRSQNDKKVFDYLEGLGLANNLINSDGQSLLHLIARNNKDLALFKHFIQAGLDSELADNNGQTPYLNAASGNTLEVLQLLAPKKATNPVNKKGQTALMLAVERNSADVVAYLIEQGGNINAKDKDGNGLAYYLLQNYNPRNVDLYEAKLALLQKANVDFTAPQNNGNTLLHLAAKENNLKLLKQLAAFQINVNQKNNEGNTALHLAAMSSKNDDILKYLIAIGADVSATTDFEETVFDLASENEMLRKNNIKLDFLKP
ncbi:hypothetical protein BUL40_03075 [Croceivirga radicis]|uniref:Uncharacterized protein n=1 Tax=Croceivirga radicis TaxID=1929488 RepID=A0A1V6LTV7_9FLAO|nr:ankyrin repeat domain-containing protein [Croceivirga radicis]OQD43611.1 hypothetical protein BUL40_03075 [Croceivirga radicis]